MQLVADFQEAVEVDGNLMGNYMKVLIEHIDKKEKKKYEAFHPNIVRNIFFATIIAFLVSLFLISSFYYSNKHSYVSAIPTPLIEKKQEYTTYFLPVTGFKEPRNNLTTQEINDTTFTVMASNSEIIHTAFPNIKTRIIEDSNFENSIANSSEIGLIEWQDLSPRLKLLRTDNQFFFDKTLDLNNYPFKYSKDVDKKDVCTKEISVDCLVSFDVNKVNRVLAMGEIIPARTVDKFMRTKDDYKYPFESVKPFLDKYDARIATFESALIGKGNGSVCALNCFDFIGNEQFTEGMQYSGINVVSLADNHSMNGGIDGIANTIKLLNGINIKTVGAAPTNNEDATKPAIFTVGTTKYGVIAYNDIPSANDWATDDKGGTARIDTNDYHIIDGRVAKDVQRAKEAGAEFVIAMMHWGAREYTNDPLPHQKELAHHLIDNGVDLVVGDHPHWVMLTEFYTPTNGTPKFIYYGIGNFVFDQDWSTETSQGSLMEMNFYNNKLLALHIHPHQIYNAQPRLLDEGSKEYKQIMNRIWQFTGKI